MIIDDEVKAAIQELSNLAPLHNPAALAGIDTSVQLYLGVPQVAAFDTAFHATIPDAAAVYPLPALLAPRPTDHCRGTGGNP